MEKISVAIRVRPPSQAQSPSVKGQKWSVGPYNVALYSTLGTPINGQNYSFDHVFGTDTKNGDIYQGLAKDVIMSSLSGFNGTVFAYGQTSSGKTYTMKGTQTDPGIIRLAIHDVFSNLRQLKNIREFLIRVSYMEIYNEEINDLLAPDNRRLQIHENLEKGIFVAGLREEIVDSPEHVFSLLEFGESHRHFGETNMNLYSSRSHTIFRMVIESRDTCQDASEMEASCDAVRVSCLNLVDLAGSERIAKTGAGGVRLKEGTHINKSLMTLGTVINKLSDGGKQGGHIPYRDSKLTRILQPALGGNAKTAMICTVTPDEIHIDETRGTLQFASRAKRVSTCAQVNEIVTDAALLKRQTKEIEELRMKLQGQPQSTHLEKEILNLRNQLLKFELEKERLSLELQEEKKAQIDRERRIKEQEQKIENLSTLFMTSTLDDRDTDKLYKKVNRRETWCPRQLSVELAIQDFRKPSDKIEDEETMDTILYSMRRERNLTLPPAFEIDEEGDSFWSGSNDIEEASPLSEFENIADEDTWMSLNKGHTTSSTVFAPGFSERNRSSAGSGAVQKVASLESQLKDLQVQYSELQSSYEVKIQESTNVLLEEIERSKQQLEEVRIENLTLKSELDAQLKMQNDFKHTLEGLELEMDAARLLTCSMQGILAESLHVQATVLVGLQDCMAAASCKARSKVKERRLLMESSVKRCRDICADVEQVLLYHPSPLQEVVSEIPNEVLETQMNLSDDVKCSDDIDAPEDKNTEGPEVSYPVAVPNRDIALRGQEVKNCKGCLSSLLLNSRPWGSEKTLLCNKCKSVASVGSCVVNHLEGSTCSNGTRDHSNISQGASSDLPNDTLPHGSMNEFRVHALRTLASRSDLDIGRGMAGAGDANPRGIWNELITCTHVGCSFGTLGRNCVYCDLHERAIIGKDQIPSEMKNLCSHILKLLQPSIREPVSEKVSNEDDGSGTEQDVNLKARLATAKLLATWLLEEIQVIVRHDLECLRCHVKDRGNVGLLLETLQVLLLQNAALAVDLLPATCQDEHLMKDLLQLSAKKDAQNNVQSVAEGTPEVGTISTTIQQAEPGVQNSPHSIYDKIDTTELGSMEELLESSTSIFSDRVLKVEGVEDMMGKVLEYSMGLLLSKEHHVMEGGTMLLVLTLMLDTSPKAENKVLHGQVMVEKIRKVESRTMKKDFEDVNGGYSIVGLDLGQEEQLSHLNGRQQGNMKFPPQLVKKAIILKELFLQGSPIKHGFPNGPEAAVMQMISTNFVTVCGKPAMAEVFFCEDQSCTVYNCEHWVGRMIETKENFAAQLLLKIKRVRELEVNLTAAELEVVELKIELEDLRAKMQVSNDLSEKWSAKQMELELQAYKNKCENYEEEIRLILEQMPTPADDLQKERQVMEIMEENQFLQGYLVKAKKHVLRSKVWRDEMRKLREVDKLRWEAASKVEAAPVAEGLDFTRPTCAAENNEGYVSDKLSRPVSAVLGVLDSNVQNGSATGLPVIRKRRRQLQFLEDENCNKEDFEFQSSARK